jgi:hypothetical protein
MNSTYSYLIFFIFIAQRVVGDWPSTTLKCFTTTTYPDGRLICPEARYAFKTLLKWTLSLNPSVICLIRSKYCVKVDTNLKADLCGGTQYFNDVWINSHCFYKNCAATCTEGESTFEYGYETYTRKTYCCDSDWCNSGSQLFRGRGILYLLCTLIVSIFFVLS